MITEYRVKALQRLVSLSVPADEIDRLALELVMEHEDGGEPLINLISSREVLRKISSSGKDIHLCIYAYKRMGGMNKDVIDNIQRLYDEDKETFSAAVTNLLAVLSRDKLAASGFWPLLEKKTSGGHTDLVGTVHHDNPYMRKSNGAPVYWDCHQSSYKREHTDTGIDIQLPPYPFPLGDN